jgi:hypothetical protein
VQCEGDLQDCDADPTDCETDITRDPAHCGGCGELCPGDWDECIASECVTPCIDETAYVMPDYNYNYYVPGDGCVKIEDHLSGYYYIQVNRDMAFTYVDECGHEGSGELQASRGSDPLPACVMLIDLLGTSPIVEISWWFGG